MVKRKLNGAMDDQEICKSKYITYEKSGGLHLVEPGLTAGRQLTR